MRRELVKYADPLRKGYPSNQLEQLEFFALTLGDLPAWVDVIEVEESDMPAFFDA